MHILPPWLLEKALLFGTCEIVHMNILIPLFSMTLRSENIIFRIPSEIFFILNTFIRFFCFHVLQ